MVRVIEFDPTTTEIVWQYAGTPEEPFESDVRASQERQVRIDVVRALAAHRSALDQHDRGTQLGRARSHAETARACADDADVGGQGLVHREGPRAARSPSAMRDYRWSIGPATTAEA